ncbi:MAG: Bifunctional phosphoglucose/phosphomannose isomerase [Candidatus Giovannonibacteria bacterium GW2011_GWA2_44_26]|uniref:Bifunctional phosphoglucose/phosphomannose isomerase n=1 Tax=Candidatus Giovannonibacteria bacterium GW2011_GWA2_44_26 TaxID=1618648 RepID=A0A0G1ISA4_9BACT|nr:MAG: Bifunctional phosphoglucose/phosphomannose isomerase [Candidatus Giovannonibacteria bacterium GW2011_GWA2_44_26]
MAMYDAIKNFPNQFSYKPEIFIHKNYNLPKVPDEILNNSLIIVSSYSGNTEEALDTYDQAKERGIPLAAISIGGKLLERAEKDGIPYVQMPDTGIQPRSAPGFNIKALLALMGEDNALQEIGALAQTLRSDELEQRGKELAKNLYGHTPVIYASEQNKSIAYNWKIKFNETSKIPAFYNVFSELNHNEMTGFDVKPKTKKLSKNFYFILLSDEADHPRIQKRMAVLKKLYQARNLPVAEIKLAGRDVLHKIFSSLILADWAAYYTAEGYGVESEAVPMVEEFKKLIG